jgi:hypothetical protein
MGNLWGIFKNRHLSNATGRIRDESVMNLGGRELFYPSYITVTLQVSLDFTE